MAVVIKWWQLINQLLLALGPEAAVAAPGTIPSDAFQRFKLSSLASSWAYSSADLAAATLYPGQTRLSSVMPKEVYDLKITWSGGGGQFILIFVLKRVNHCQDVKRNSGLTADMMMMMRVNSGFLRRWSNSLSHFTRCSLKFFHFTKLLVRALPKVFYGGVHRFQSHNHWFSTFRPLSINPFLQSGEGCQNWLHR